MCSCVLRLFIRPLPPSTPRMIDEEEKEERDEEEAEIFLMSSVIPEFFESFPVYSDGALGQFVRSGARE